MTVIETRDNGNIKQAFVLYRNEFYVVSDNGSETLIFSCDAMGTVTNFNNVGGAKAVTLSEVLSDISGYLY
tara:strand:+ start:222 stop:434 length:213 start_codon:yes stop_codon:yes gene_type:complete